MNFFILENRDIDMHSDVQRQTFRHLASICVKYGLWITTLIFEISVFDSFYVQLAKSVSVSEYSMTNTILKILVVVLVSLNLQNIL